MICSSCGTQNADNAMFCKGCGASLASGNNAQQNNQGYQQAYQQNYRQQTYQQNYQQAYGKMEKIYSSNPAINAVKKAAASPMFLTGAILYTIFLFFQLISSFSSGAIFTYMWEMMRYELMYEYNPRAFSLMEKIIDTMQSVTVVTSLSGMIPTILIGVGIWMIFASGKKVMEQGMKTGGITLIKVITILQFVLYCIIMALGIIATLVFLIVLPNLINDAMGLDYMSLSNMVQMSPSGGEEFVPLVLVIILLFIMFLIMVVALVLSILFYVKAIKSMNVIKKTAENGKVDGEISMFFIVMLFIFGGLSCVSFTITGLLSGVSMIFFGIALVNLRKELNKLSPENKEQNFGYNPNMSYQAQQIPTNNF